MSLQAARLVATVSVSGAAAAKAALGGFSDSIDHTQGTLHKLGGAVSSGLGQAVQNIERLGVAGATAGVGLGIASVKMAMSFQQQMEMIHTQAGATQAEVQSMSKAILGLSTQTGTGANDLAAALFHLESAGFRGATATNALRIAAEGAKVGNANLVDVTNALDAVLVAGGKDAQDMSGSMGMLNAVVGAGDMTMQDLADAMGTGILANAHNFGVGLKDVGAALAVFGDNNIRGSAAAVLLRQALYGIGAPTAASSKALKSLGLTSLDLAQTMRSQGLLAALTELKQHLDTSGLTATQQADVISKAFGGKKGSTGILVLLDQLTRLQQKEKNVGDGAGAFGADWAATTQTVSYQWGQFLTDLQTAGITIGSALLPPLLKAMSGINSLLSQNQGKLQEFAAKVGGAFEGFITDLEKVNWSQVASVFGHVADGVKSIIDAFLTAPDWVKEVMIGGFALNKLTGGMVTNVGGIAAGGLTKTVENLLLGALSKVPVVGGVLGSIGATRVYVTNWPASFGPGGPIGPTGGGGALRDALEFAAKIALVGVVADIASQISGPVQQAGIDLHKALGLPTIDITDVSWPFGPKNTPTILPGIFGGNGLLGGTPASNAPGSSSGPTLIGEHSALGQNLIDSINTADRVNAAKQDMTGLKIDGLTAAVNHQTDAIHLDFIQQRDALKKATSPADILKAAQGLVKDMVGGVGSTKTTASVIDELKAKEMTVTDPKTRAAIDKLISTAQHELDVRSRIDTMIHKDDGILSKSSLTAGQITRVKNDIAFIKDHGDRVAAAKLQALLNKKSSISVSLTNSTTVNVDGRNVAHVIHRWQAPFPTYGPTGSAF